MVDSVGTDSILADMTYDFGFDLLAAGDWLPSKLADRNIGRVATFPLGFDSQRLPRPRFLGGSRRGPVLPAAGDSPPRLGVRSGGTSHLPRSAPRGPVIHLVGGRTNLRMPFPATIHDVMTPEELAALYNKCRVVLAISLSNTSLLPVEMLACGTEVVTNESESNRANLGSVPGVTLASLTVNDLAEALLQAYATPVDPAELAAHVGDRTWDHAFDSAVGFIYGAAAQNRRSLNPSS